MKKICYILSVFLLLLFGIGIACYFALPKTISYFASKAINGSVNIEDIKIGYDRALIFNVKSIEFKGDINGFIKSVYISFSLKKKLFFDNIIISDFEIDIKPLKKQKPQFIKIPSEHINVKNGIVKYENYVFTINNVKLDYDKNKKSFIFSMDIENDKFFRSFKAEGTGIYSKRKLEIKGKTDILGINIGQISNDLKGKADLSGIFSYDKNGLKFEGPFNVADFYLKLNFFSIPLQLKNVGGRISLAYSKNLVDIKINGVKFKTTPIELNFKLDSEGLKTLVINSDYIDIMDVKKYISFSYISKDVDKYIDFIKNGKVKTDKFIYNNRDDLFLCDLSIKDMGLIYESFELTQVQGNILFDNNKAKINRLEGRYKNSEIKDISGEISYGKGYYARLKGRYFVDLTDIPSKFDLGSIRFKNGTSEGDVEFEYKGEDYRLSGKGILNNSEVSYNNISMIATGNYNFSKDEVEFNPLILSKHDTKLRLKGKWRKNFLNLKILGNLDVEIIKKFIKIPFHVEGTADIDADISKQENTLQLLCNVNLDQLSYMIEHCLKKEKGIKNSFMLNTLKRDEFIEIRDFNFKLEDLNLSLSGILSKKGARNVKLKLIVPELKNKDYLMFIKGSNEKGYVSVDLDVKEILFPLKNIPSIYGRLEIKNGYVKIPDISLHINNFDVMAYFNGDKLDLKINNIKSENSLIKSLEFNSRGIQKPEFKLSLNIENLDFKDFETKVEKKIKFYSIEPDSVLASAKGDITLKAKEIKTGNKVGNDIILRVNYDNRIFNMLELKGNALDGYIDACGYVDLSRVIPEISLIGKMNGISSGDFLRMLGAKTQIIESKEFIFFDINFKGNDIDGFKRTLSGKTTIYSENGVIKKMNLLSKILGLLNVYDLLRGKVDFMSTGFNYKKTGATFIIKNGVFTTDNYIIESPAMIITGQGNLNLIDETMEGIVTVFPFVTLDKIISKIPFLKNILKDKKKGVVTAVFNVKGPIEDPDVKLAYMQTFSSFIMNILRGVKEMPESIIKFPKELYK